MVSFSGGREMKRDEPPLGVRGGAADLALSISKRSADNPGEGKCIRHTESDPDFVALSGLDVLGWGESFGPAGP
jgi:hypothetical protein